MNKQPSSTIVTRLCWGVFFLVLLFLVIQVMPRALGQREGSKERLIDAEAEWIWQNPLPQGNTLQDFFFIDTNNGFAVGASGTILRTTDGGNNWDILASGTNYDLYGVSFTDANTGTAVGNFGAILRTTDAGNNWIIQREGTSDVLYGVSFTDANNGTAVGSGGLILRTTDGGASWINQTSGTTNSLNDVFFTDANNGTSVGDNGYNSENVKWRSQLG